MVHKNISDEHVAIVTGAGSGIGAQLVASLISKDWSVVAVDQEFSGDAFKNDKLKFLVGDVRDDSTIKTALSMASQLGQLWGLANVAGVRGYREFIKIDQEFLQSHLSINTIAPLLWIQAVANLMIENSINGSIVNITSVMSERVVKSNGAYCISKAGLSALTKIAALELATFGIRVNAVAPGPTDTAMLSVLDEDQREGIVNRLPLKRLGTPSDITEAVLFLLERGSFITGSTIYVDGGYLVA
jgi:NAD(P)-dependent dehydrogenase (short-subunit alcohol dehydrogenase family)